MQLRTVMGLEHLPRHSGAAAYQPGKGRRLLPHARWNEAASGTAGAAVRGEELEEAEAYLLEPDAATAYTLPGFAHPGRCARSFVIRTIDRQEARAPRTIHAVDSDHVGPGLDGRRRVSNPQVRRLAMG